MWDNPEFLTPIAHRQDQIFSLVYNPAGSTTIVLLHGLGATSESWIFQVPDLVNRGFRVLCPDIPGFGQSGWVGRIWSVKAVADALAAWMKSIAPHGCHLAGISMGGAFAIQLALEFPEQVKHLVLVSAFARLSTGNPKKWVYFLKRYYLVARYGLKAQAGLVASRIFPAEDQKIYREAFINQVLQSDERTYTQALVSLGVFNVENRLGEIHKPVLIVSGENDNTIPLDVQNTLADRIHNARHVIIPGAGHAVTVDQAAEFNRILMVFLPVV